jgi:hypothetical protein
MLIILLLALFPILYLFEPRLAMGALLMAIVALYRKHTASIRPKPPRPEPNKSATPWKDPWDTTGIDL